MYVENRNFFSQNNNIYKKKKKEEEEELMLGVKPRHIWALSRYA